MTPMFTVHAGEYLVANYIESKFCRNHGVRVWVPSKDDGIDLLVTNKDCREAVSLQVKFSKNYINGGDCNSSGWWQIKNDKLKYSNADYWVFVMPEFTADRKNKDTLFLSIPPHELLNRLLKIFGFQQQYTVYFARRNASVVLTRGLKKKEVQGLFDTPQGNRDFSRYLNNFEEVLKRVL